jgi:Uma2 family endonuclease
MPPIVTVGGRLSIDPAPPVRSCYDAVMDAILEPLLRSPKLFQFLDELIEFYREEAANRRHFRASLDEDIRAEFINGEVLEQPPATNKHCVVVSNVGTLADIFIQLRQLGLVRTEQALTKFPRNDYAPDVCFWTTAKATTITPGTVIYPVPDFIIEVLAPGTESRDRGVKFEDYAAHSVGEYWIIDPNAEAIEQYIGRDEHYQLAAKHSEGIIRSAVIAGFRMPVKAAFEAEPYLAALRNLLK